MGGCRGGLVKNYKLYLQLRSKWVYEKLAILQISRSGWLEPNKFVLFTLALLFFLPDPLYTFAG
jgi:hypothetical protein